MSDFFDAIRRFLLDYLPKQRCLSKNTILSYRQTLNIFVAYMRDEIGIGAAELTFSRVDRDVILNFLTWLEKARGCSVSTRNQRLMALRSFPGLRWTNRLYADVIVSFCLQYSLQGGSRANR